MKSKVSVTIEEGLRNRVAELASLEQRNFSQMFEVLVGLGLERRRDEASNVYADFGSGDVFVEWSGSGVAVGPGIGGSGATGAATVTAADAPPGSEGEVAGQSPAASPSKPRLKPCEHRMPADAWFRWCDG